MLSAKYVANSHIDIVASPICAYFSDYFCIRYSKPLFGAIALSVPPTPRLVDSEHSREGGAPRLTREIYEDASISFLTHCSSPPRAMISCTFGLVGVNYSYNGMKR